MNRDPFTAAASSFEQLEGAVAADRAKRRPRRLHMGLTLGVLVASAVVFAQDRTITVREVDVLPQSALIRIMPDGGCSFTGYATVVAPSVAPVTQQSEYAFNGARCTTIKNAIVTAAKKDMQVGDGSLP